MKEINSLFINFISFLYITCNVHGNNEDATTVSRLFAGSNNSNRCTGQRKSCGNEKKPADKEDESSITMIGPKFQKVHLELPRINPIRTGHTRKLSLIEGKIHKMKTLSIHPPIFEIKKFLSEDECEAIIELAKEKGMKKPISSTNDLKFPNRNDHSAFDKWDKDLDGFLSKEEVSAIEEIKHLLLAEEDITQMYQDLELIPDENGHLPYGELERLTFAKFKSYLQNLHEKKANISVHQIEQTWLWQDEDDLLVYEDVLQNYHQRLSNLTRIPTDIIKESEPVMITKFKNGSFTECRHDSAQIYSNVPCCVYGATSACRICRFISIMYFLNDVPDGELLFPLANNKTYDWNDLHKHTSKVCSKAPNISLSNLAIKPEKGKAIMWYNHYIGRDTGWMSSLDPLSFYGTNKVTEADKWVATTWININGDGVNELRPWKMGCNWLSENNKNNKIIEDMRNDDFIEGELYLHDAKLIAIDDEDIDDDNSDSFKDVTIRSIEDVTDDVFDKIDGNSQKPIVKNPGEPSTNEIISDSEHNEKQPDEEHCAGANRDMESAPKTVQIEVSQNSSSVDVIENHGNELIESNRSETKDSISANQQDIGSKRPSKRNRSPELDEGPLGPPMRGLSHKSNDGPSLQRIKNELHYLLPSGKIVENKVVMSVLMLLEELGRDELEVVARTLHEKLQLACIPIMVNPIGPM